MTTLEKTPPSSLEQAFVELPGDGGIAGARLIADNVEAWAVRWDLVSSARRTIDVSYFILEPDVFGLAFIGLLARKAREGVRVRVTIDARGSTTLGFPGGRDYLQELVAAGDVEVHFYNPLLAHLPEWLVTSNIIPVIASAHDKVLIVDDESALTGGRNVGAQYLVDPRDRADAWIDADILIGGREPLQEMIATFERTMHSPQCTDIYPDLVNLASKRDELDLLATAMDRWLRGPAYSEPRADAIVLSTAARTEERDALLASSLTDHKERIAEDIRERVAERLLQLVHYPRSRGSVPVHAASTPIRAPFRLLSKPTRLDPHVDTITPGILHLLAGARRAVVLETPYFTPTRALIEAFSQASARGVQIVVLTNGPNTSDNDAGMAMFFDSWPEVMALAPTMELYVLNGKRPLHAKRMVVDDEVTMVGTYNIDPLSRDTNSEIGVVLESRTFAAENLEKMAAFREGALQYRIALGENGDIELDERGRVKVAFGPADHCSPETLAALRDLNRALVGIRGMFDFDIPVHGTP